jgi:tetratricopeptide (TPR) repeat protein
VNLRQHNYDVFWDVSSIDSGEFDNIILNQIAARTHFVVILTPGTLDSCIHPDGSENKEDWLRREIERAIDLRRNIVPLLLENFNFKDAEKYLTGKLATLARYNALDVPWTYLEEAMQRLRTRYLKAPEQPVNIRPTPAAEQVIVQQRIDEAASQSPKQGKKPDTKAFFEQGLLRFDKGDYAAAIDEFSQAIRLAPEYTPAYILRGGAYRAIGDLDNATADFSEVLRQNPKEPDAYVGRGMVRKDQGDVAGAVADWNQYLALDGSRQAKVRQWISESASDLEHSAKTYFERGYKQWKAGNTDSAIADFTSAITLDPKHTFAYASREDARVAKREYDGAIADYSEATRLNPEQASHYKSRGLAHRRKRNSAEAISDLQKYLDLGGGKQYGDQREVEKMIGEMSR